MSHDVIELQEGAVLVADAHYADYRPLFKSLIDKIESGTIETTQLVLMGDVFDLLFAPMSRLQSNEADIIRQLNRLSQKIEIIYLEGNHDFLLKKIFPRMKIYTLAQQPVAARFKGKSGWLAHGDWGGDLKFRVFTKIIRSSFNLFFLNLLDRLFFYRISDGFRRRLASKKICSDFRGFEEHIKKRFLDHPGYKGWFVEGHYHQGSSFSMEALFYRNLSALACNQSYFVVQSNKDEISLSECTL